MKKVIIGVILIFLLLFVIDILYSLTYSIADALPPAYLEHMELCKQEGGKIEDKTKDAGGFDVLDKWKCVCGSSQLFFGEKLYGKKLACNQWLEPEISNVSSFEFWYKRLVYFPLNDLMVFIGKLI
ncbi:MAG: hypothetical protein NTV48_02535 [Candidatus Vogelbacteria bacterium]|nr:hypothetical protein [Candidatus Vogelbacteria bacterium]